MQKLHRFLFRNRDRSKLSFYHATDLVLRRSVPILALFSKSIGVHGSPAKNLFEASSLLHYTEQLCPQQPINMVRKGEDCSYSLCFIRLHSLDKRALVSHKFCQNWARG